MAGGGGLKGGRRKVRVERTIRLRIPALYGPLMVHPRSAAENIMSNGPKYYHPDTKLNTRNVFSLVYREGHPTDLKWVSFHETMKLGKYSVYTCCLGVGFMAHRDRTLM